MRGLELNDIVRLTIDGETLPYRVEWLQELALMLDPVEPPEGYEQPTDSGPATLSFTNPRGVYEALGEAMPGTAGTLMVRFEADSKPKLIQRRDFVRIDCDRPARVTLDHPEGAATETRALNLSGGGALVERIEGASEGDQVWLTVDLGDGEPPIEARARVTRETPQGNKGLRIEHITESARERLIHFVFEEQRHRPAVRGQ